MRTLVRWVNTLTRSSRPFLIGAALSAAVGALLYVMNVNIIERDAKQRFNSVARTAHFTILSRVKSYTDVLRGVASLFQTSSEITQEQFHRYVAGLRLEKEFPGIETINYAVLVKDAERAEFERRMNVELAALGKPTPFRVKPPGRRDEYLVLTMIEPTWAEIARLGYDVASGPRSLAPLFRSRDTGGVAASGRPIPMSKPVLGIRLPVYRPGMPIENVAQRRAAYIGSIGIGFNVQALVAGVLEELPVRGVQLSLIGLVDDERRGNPQRLMLYDSQQRGKRDLTAESRDDEYHLTLPIEFSERNWETEFRVKKSAMLTAVDVYAPWMALIAGFVSTALLYALFHALASSRRHAIGLAEEMTEEFRASEANLQQSYVKLRELAAHADNIKEIERKRIAREIHDDLGQNLLALRIEADQLALRTGDRHPLLHKRARQTLFQIDSTIKSVRQIINDLRPNVLDLGLNAAVAWQIADFRRRTGIDCDLTENDSDIKVSDRCATALFRILQESLTNVSRHANASRVAIELRAEPDWIFMSVSDNGKGLQASGRHKPGSFGLAGIEERVKILGGQCTIGDGPRGGTRISVRVPLTDRVAQPEQADSDAIPDKAGNALV